MSDNYAAALFVHILSSTILFGTGIGTAFQMWAANRTQDARAIAIVARNVVLADLYFTTSAVIVQPLSGAYLIYITGMDATASWLVLAYALYLLTGACWLPVVWIQVRLRDLAEAAGRDGAPLPLEYTRLMRWWVWLGWPAFLSVAAIFWLMITTPTLW
jgi:uncharacterized membrane protein